MATYSKSFKSKIVQRLLLPDGPSAYRLSKEIGVPQPTLSRWRKEFGRIGAVSNDNAPRSASRPRRPEDWSAAERLRAVTESARLSDEELGEFLRREGLHEEILAEWRAVALEALGPPRPRQRGDRKRIEKLEKDLARKEKQLRASKALVELSKKVHALWAEKDGDTPEENEK